MVLRGVLDRPFGACICLRGYAPFIELAKASRPDTVNYQRETLKSHLTSLEQFYKTASDDAFFPEVILGISLVSVGAEEEEIRWLFNEALETGGPCRKFGRISLSVSARDYKKGKTPVRFVTGIIDGLDCSGNNRQMFRIDGNHRLTAVENPEINEKVKQWKVPFCLLFFKDEITCTQRSATYFSNINFKVEPLSREQNIRTVVAHEEEFPDSVLFDHESYGSGFVFCRKIWKTFEDKIDVSDDDVSRFVDLKDAPCTFLQEVGESLCKDNPDANDVKSVYVISENAYEALEKWLKACKGIKPCFCGFSRVVREAIAYYYLEDQKALAKSKAAKHNGGRVAKGPFNKCARFMAWIRNAHIEKLNGIPLKELLKIFDSVYELLPKKLFLARWYPESGDEKRKSDARYEAIVKMAKAKDLNFEVVDMEHQHSGAFSIRDAIDNEIPESDLFIADLTGARPNVMVEVGMALHHLPKNRVLFFMQKADVPGMTDPVDKPPFDLSGYSYDRIVDSSEIEKHLGSRIRGILNLLPPNGDEANIADSEKDGGCPKDDASSRESTSEIVDGGASSVGGNSIGGDE